jgi:ABC-type iron transport system FetAB ATPase subunit
LDRGSPPGAPEKWRELEIAPGRPLFLTGPTGCGKSLLLRALADLDPVDGGTVRLDGRDRAEFRPTEWRRRVLYVHQGAPRLAGTVRGNVARIVALGTGGAGAVDRVLGEVGLAPEADAGRLSGGEAQLLALARALCAGPDVYLLDEATTGLDGAALERVLGIVTERLRAGKCVLWVTHDERIATRLDAEVVRW